MTLKEESASQKVLRVTLETAIDTNNVTPFSKN